MDIQLGVSFDARLLCNEIKQIKKLSTIPIILFSANRNYGKNISQYLCDDFIAKPFEIASPIELIQKHIGLLN